MADNEAQVCGAAGGVAPPAGEGAEQQANDPSQQPPDRPSESRTSESRRSEGGRASESRPGDGRPSRPRRSIVAETSTGTAANFCLEIVIRVMPSAIIVFAIGVLVGSLKNHAAWHLLDQGEAMNWTQPWTETRERELKGAWGNQTYVEFMNTSVHLYRDEFEHAPKYDDKWIITFYARNAIESSVGCGAPIFIIWALHGFHRTKRITLISFLPFVLAFLFLYLTCAYTMITVGHPPVGQLTTQMIVGGLVALQALVVLPLVGRRLNLAHIWKSVVLPFCILVVGLAALQNMVPMLSERIRSEWVLVLFRVVGYTIMQELFVGGARILQRLVPLSEEDDYRPEDKIFSVLPIDCLFGYWGRIILMDLTETGPILVANLAIAAGEFVARITVVQRDKLYLRLLWNSSSKQTEYWQKNAVGMQRFRCSMITSHLFAEYLMIATAAGYYYASGIAPNITAHLFNCATQFLSEVFCDAATLGWEIFRDKLPVIPAWDMRRAYFGIMFGLFAVGFNLFAMSRSANYFCGMKHPDYTERNLWSAVYDFSGRQGHCNWRIQPLDECDVLAVSFDGRPDLEADAAAPALTQALLVAPPVKRDSEDGPTHSLPIPQTRPPPPPTPTGNGPRRLLVTDADEPSLAGRFPPAAAAAGAGESSSGGDEVSVADSGDSGQ